MSTSWIDVRDFGAIGDGITDDTAAIQSAIDACNGGVVYFPPLPFKITDTLLLTKHHVSLLGDGASHTSDVAITITGTRLFWAGPSGGTMLLVSAVSGTGLPALKCPCVKNITLDGVSGLAAIGLSVKSAHRGQFDNLYFKNFSTFAIDCGCFEKGPELGEAADNTKCLFSNINIRQLSGSATSGGGLRLGGSSNANTSNNDFLNVSINHKDGTAIQCVNVDNNRYYGIVINRASGGTGLGVELCAGASADEKARSECFFYIAVGTGGLVARGTPSGTYPSINNKLFLYSRDNGAPAPVLESGATLFMSPDCSSGSTTYDPPSLAKGSSATTTLSLPGAVVGDFVIPSFSLDLMALDLSAWVSAAGVVSLKFQNDTNGTINLGSGTLKAMVMKA